MVHYLINLLVILKINIKGKLCLLSVTPLLSIEVASC